MQQKMKILFYLLIAILVSNCKKEQSNMTVTIFKDGKPNNYSLSLEDERKVNEIVKNIFLGINENLKLYFSEERLKDLINSEEALEIIYNEPITLSTKEFGSFSVKKIIFPLTGDFIGNVNSPEITIIPGEEEYDTTPLRNTTGYNLLMELKELVESAKSQ
jgi:hypothetical protein